MARCSGTEAARKKSAKTAVTSQDNVGQSDADTSACRVETPLAAPPAGALPKSGVRRGARRRMKDRQGPTTSAVATVFRGSRYQKQPVLLPWSARSREFDRQRQAGDSVTAPAAKVP